MNNPKKIYFSIERFQSELRIDGIYRTGVYGTLLPPDPIIFILRPGQLAPSGPIPSHIRFEEWVPPKPMYYLHDQNLGLQTLSNKHLKSSFDKNASTLIINGKRIPIRPDTFMAVLCSAVVKQKPNIRTDWTKIWKEIQGTDSASDLKTLNAQIKKIRDAIVRINKTLKANSITNGLISWNQRTITRNY